MMNIRRSLHLFQRPIKIRRVPFSTANGDFDAVFGKKLRSLIIGRGHEKNPVSLTEANLDKAKHLSKEGKPEQALEIDESMEKNKIIFPEWVLEKYRKMLRGVAAGQANSFDSICFGHKKILVRRRQ